MEDYLEIISELVELKGYATTLDISRYMNVSAPSVTKMLQRLDEGGFLEYEKYHGINLTKKGIQIAEGIRQNHGILLEFFEILGVGFETANQDTEGIEHHLNPKTIKQLRKFITFLKKLIQKLLKILKIFEINLDIILRRSLIQQIPSSIRTFWNFNLSFFTYSN